MNDLPTITLAPNLTMSSIEIAKLTEKRHDNVVRDLQVLDDLDVIDLLKFEEIETFANNRKRKVYHLPQRETLILTSGYSAEQRAKIIDRWLELEGQQAQAPKPLPTPTTPIEIGVQIIDLMVGLGARYRVPESYALQVAAEAATEQTSLPFDRLLTSSEIMDDVPEEDVYLEPTDLGRHFGLSGAQMNKQLAHLGLQTFENKHWQPTLDGTLYAQRHAWTSGRKSGYNYKWSLAGVRSVQARLANNSENV